ncbi:hypothetical protein EDC04DRAFT_2897624 [Pisolithus marmoratus]|nr:hypothetical protein EDC04DRAFT_2897624 [Pisolithus marmoratus]
MPMSPPKSTIHSDNFPPCHPHCLQPMEWPPPISLMRQYSRFDLSHGPRPSIDGPGTRIFSAGDSVAIHPEGSLEFHSTGDPILMSYWFATIKSFYVQDLHPGMTIWAEVEWLYRRSNLLPFCPSLAHTIAENELVRSDHSSLINVKCIECIQPIHHTTPACSRGSPIPTAIPFSRYSIHVDIMVNTEGTHVPSSAYLIPTRERIPSSSSVPS